MLRRIFRRPLRRPRFPEGEVVPWRGLAFVVGLSVLAVGAAFLPAGGIGTEHWQAILVLAALAALTPLFSVYGPSFTVYDTAAVFVVAAAVLASPAVAALVGIASCLTDALRRRVSVISFIHNSATIALAACAASALAHHAAGLPAVSRVLTLIFAVTVYAFVITGADALFGYFARGDAQPLLPPASFIAEAALASLGIGFAALVVEDPWLAPFVLAPLLFIHRLQHLPVLEDEAGRDPKTGLLNMRIFERELERLCAGGTTFARPLSLLVVDLDHLREINNRFGHLAGDAVIAAVARLIVGQLRPSDRAARFGGEEFVVAIPDIEPAQALAVATRLREAVAATVFEAEDPFFRTRATVSIGVAHAPADATRPRELLHAADLALLQAKLLGRNQVLERGRLDSSRPAAPVASSAWPPPFASAPVPGPTNR
jgi:diguanylate cyclase (GGDEF)-like protein